MDRPRRATAAYNTRASNRSRSPEVKNHVSKTIAKKSTAPKKKGSTVTGCKLNAYKDSGGESTDDDADSNDENNIARVDFSALLANYVGPLDDESARERMTGALYLWNWKLLGHYADDRSSSNASPTERAASRSCSSPSIVSPALRNNATINSGDSAEWPSKLGGKNDSTVVGNGDGELERLGNNEATHPPRSPASSLTSIDSSDLNRPSKIQSKKPAKGKKKRVASSAASEKLPRGRACLRCKSRKLKCGTGDTCPPCAQAGVVCSRPQ